MIRFPTVPRRALPLLAAAVASALLVMPPGGIANAQGMGGGRGAGPAGAPAQGPREVGVVALEMANVPGTVTLPGRAVAYQSTAIRPQVGGEITEIAYRPGQIVKAGDVLFRLDDDQLAATLSAATAAVTSAEAAVRGAQATVGRYDRLQGTGVSRADLESAQVDLASARARLASAEADRDMAQLAVDRSEIHSPIDGLADIAAVSVGDLVTANQGDALTTVTQLDPIYVDVSESRARVLRNRERRAQGTLSGGDAPVARLVLETGQLYAEVGEMVTPGTQVSPTTGTVPFRFQFPNRDRLILPGQFVRVQLTIGSVAGVLVPQRATRRSASGELTAFVARNGKAEEVALTEAGTHENAWIVTEGVAAGDALILDGLTNLKAGAEITTVPVEIDAEGVVRDANGGGAPPPAEPPAAPTAVPADTPPAAAPADTPRADAPAADAPRTAPTTAPTPAAN